VLFETSQRSLTMGYDHTASNDNVMAFAFPGDDAGHDLDLANAVTQAAANLQRAMDAAIQAGLLVEPSFQTAEFRSTSLGTPTETYVVNLQILRKLI
jgi:hypothetical protein